MFPKINLIVLPIKVTIIIIIVIIIIFQLHYQFDCGSGPAEIIGRNSVNNNQWHTVTFKRENNTGELIVDDDPPVHGNSIGDAKLVDVVPPFYVGGVPPELSNRLNTITVSGLWENIPNYAFPRPRHSKILLHCFCNVLHYFRELIHQHSTVVYVIS